MGSKRKSEGSPLLKVDNSNNPKDARVALRQLGSDESLLFAIPPHLLRLIIFDYVYFPHYPVLRFVCVRMKNLLLCQGCGQFFVPNMTTRGYFRLARWAYEKGAPFSILWRESYLKAANLDDLEAIKWMAGVATSESFGVPINTVVRINTAVFEVFVESARDDALEFLRDNAAKGQKRYNKATYLWAILNDDLETIQRLADMRVPPGRRFIEKAVEMDAPQYLEALRHNNLLSPSRIGYRCIGAARAGSAKFLSWFVECGFELNEYFYKCAIDGGQHGILKLLIQDDQFRHFKAHATRHAAFRNDLKSLNMMARVGALPDAYDVVKAAAEKESKELLIWANAHGVLGNRDVPYQVGHPNHAARVAWVKETLRGLGIQHDEWCDF